MINNELLAEIEALEARKCEIFNSDLFVKDRSLNSEFYMLSEKIHHAKQQLEGEK